MRTSLDGINLIKSFEGCRLESYLCPAHIPTIGYGHTGSDVKMGMKITKKKATEYLKKDLEKFEKKVNKYNDIYDWKQCEFDSMVSFCYNIGNIDSVTNNGKRSKKEIELALPKYNNGGGKVLKGLVRRRDAELKMFRGGDDNAN